MSSSNLWLSCWKVRQPWCTSISAACSLAMKVLDKLWWMVWPCHRHLQEYICKITTFHTGHGCASLLDWQWVSNLVTRRSRKKIFKNKNTVHRLPVYLMYRTSQTLITREVLLSQVWPLFRSQMIRQNQPSSIVMMATFTKLAAAITYSIRKKHN